MNFTRGEILPIDKPYGISSFGALARIRTIITHRLNGKYVKIGHAGTLDPLATGVLLLCTGKKTKEIEQLQCNTKEYQATLRLGATTQSFDREYTVDHTWSCSHITLSLIERTLSSFKGDVMQVPPEFSACKIRGQRAYKIKRKGHEVMLKPKQIHIDSIDIVSFDKLAKMLTLRIVCGKGTYIRALARDIGMVLGCGAYLIALRRTRVGDFLDTSCLSLDSFSDWLDTQIIEG